jgi:hypothetical protein
MTETSSSQQLPLQHHQQRRLLASATSEKGDDDDDDDDNKTADAMESSSNSSSTSNNGDDAFCIWTLKEEEEEGEQKKVLPKQKQQQQKPQQRVKILAAVVGLVIIVLVCGGAIAAVTILVPQTSLSSSWSSSTSTTNSSSSGCCANKNKEKPNQANQAPQPQGSSSGSSSSSSSSSTSSSSSWISLTLPKDLSVRSTAGAIAMNTDGSILAIGDPRQMDSYNEGEPPSPYPGRVILLQQQAVADDDEEQGNSEGAAPFYRTVQILQVAPNDDYIEYRNNFALALSSSSSSLTNKSTTLVVGIPRTVGPTVQVYVQQQTAAAAAIDRDDTADDHAQDDAHQYWEMVDVLPNQSDNDETGSWVVVSDDGNRILYSAPNYQPPDNDIARPADDDWYNPTTPGAVWLWHNGEPEVFLRGGCARERFGQTVSMSSGVDDAPPVVVVTRAGCFSPNATYGTVTVWEGGGDDNDTVVTDLVVRDPNPDCTIGGTGTAAKVSKDGKRIVVLADCLDQATHRIKQAIYTFEKDPMNSQAWVERVSDNNEGVVVLDSSPSSYRMSSFAFDDDAKTVVLTAAGEGRFDLVCYQWNETTVSWQESWRKDPGNEDEDFGIATAVALSGNGKRLAMIAESTFTDLTRLAVYELYP